MTLPVRERILANFTTVLGAMTVSGGYNYTPIHVERRDAPVSDAMVYPSIDVIVASDNKSGIDTVGLNDVVFSILRVRVRYHLEGDGAALSLAMSDIIKAVLADPFRDQNAHYTEFSGETEVNAEQQWADVLFDVRYSFLRTDPTTRG